MLAHAKMYTCQTPWHILHQKSPVLHQKSPIFHKRALYSTKRSLISTKRALYFMYLCRALWLYERRISTHKWITLSLSCPTRERRDIRAHIDLHMSGKSISLWARDICWHTDLTRETGTVHARERERERERERCSKFSGNLAWLLYIGIWYLYLPGLLHERKSPYFCKRALDFCEKHRRLERARTLPKIDSSFVILFCRILGLFLRGRRKRRNR